MHTNQTLWYGYGCVSQPKRQDIVYSSLFFFPLHLNENPTLLFRHLIHGVLDDYKQIDLILRLHYNVSVSQHSWTPGVVVKPPMKTASLLQGCHFRLLSFTLILSTAVPISMAPCATS